MRRDFDPLSAAIAPLDRTMGRDARHVGRQLRGSVMTAASQSLASGGDTTGRHAEYLELAEKYDLSLAQRGLGYPSSPKRTGCVCMKLVEAESGIGYESLAHDTAIRRKIIKAAKMRGIESRLRARLNQSHSLAELREICLARAQYERPRDKVFLADIKAWFRLLGKKNNLAFDAATALSEVSTGGEADTTEVWRFAAVCLAEAREGLGAPGMFNLRLKFECALRGVYPTYLARMLSVKVRLVERWVMASGARRGLTTEHKRHIERLEAFFGLAPGTLWSLVSRKHVRAATIYSADLPLEWRAPRQKRELLKKNLPRDFSSRPEHEKPRLLAEAFAKMDARAKTPRGKIAKQRRDRYALRESEISPTLAGEFEEMWQNRLPKVLPFGDFDQHIGWNDESFGKWKKRFCSYLGFLHRRLPELRYVENYEAPDGTYVNVPIKDLTLAFGIVPDLVEAYESWLNWRKGEFDREKKPTKDDIEFVSELERLTRPRKKVSFAEKLRVGPNSFQATTK
jgi:hypothetical protein